MKKMLVIGSLACIIACSTSFSGKSPSNKYPLYLNTFEDTLLFLYSQPQEKWPKPFIDSGVVWTELDAVHDSSSISLSVTQRDKVELGKLLFFDPRLSGSAKISCATCHVPDLSWTDGREKSVGHDGQLNKRNAPTILNVWFYKQLFWDGRSSSLEDQAFSPINSESEMHSSMAGAITTIRRIEAYKPLFQKAFGSSEISPETLTEALAVFERTIVSNKASFDLFIEGNTAALDKSALRGLHLFRTKARCMNCHNGPMFSDNSFHNIGLSDYGNKHQDLGRYVVTHTAEDVGRFKTPSLRDVMRTRPWMHNGLFNNMDAIIELYNDGMPVLKPTTSQVKDPLFPQTDPLIKKLNLTKQEQKDLLAFLEGITAPPKKIGVPQLP